MYSLFQLEVRTINSQKREEVIQQLLEEQEKQLNLFCNQEGNLIDANQEQSSSDYDNEDDYPKEAPKPEY